MVYILSILLFILDKINSYMDQTKTKCQTYIAYRVFLVCQGEGTQEQNKKQRNKQAQHFELTLLLVLLSFSVGNGEFHLDGKDGSFIFLTAKNGEIIKILIFVILMIILMQTLVELS